MPRGFRQGWYKLKNPHKYTGDPDNIRYMSSWELSMHTFLDTNPNVLRWSSESIYIPYVKPTDNQVHRYYPDYWIEFKNKEGKIVQEIIEVKPSNQTRKTKAKRGSKRRLYEEVTYAINTAKWRSAKQFCDKYGIKFRIVTERELFR